MNLRKIKNIHYQAYRQDFTQLKPQTNKTLVILHLYYPEMWPYFKEKLERIGPYDLIATIPWDKREYTPTDINTDPAYSAVYFTNRGRDILPFIHIAKKISLNDYGSVLKLHTKKSPHFEDGMIWLDGMVESLTSIKGDEVSNLFQAGVAMIGPKKEYYSLRVNFEANGITIDNLMRQAVGKNKQHEITQLRRGEFGFFAGSMFWVGPSYLTHLVKMLSLSVRLFEKEAGQIDGTFAHGFERIVSLVAEAEQRQLMSVDNKGDIEPIAIGQGIIPKWSEHYESN